ncbi:sugar kinase [Microtetraspora glauca]|uniref:Sugar kinase n=1 Tax=Microtetraspora glauca TaxID=1996 RepID=A0ABV3GNT4_MICGL
MSVTDDLRRHPVTSPDVVAVGEAMLLLQPPAGDALGSADHLEVHIAGAELNVCAAVARLGLRASFASRVGDDPFGLRVVAEARALGVATDLVEVDPERPTGVYFKDVRPDGRRRVHYYRSGSAAAALGRDDAARILACRPRAVAFTGITAALGQGPLDLVRSLIDGAHRAGTMVVLDPNFRPNLAPTERIAAALRPMLDRVGLLALGQDESADLLGATHPEDVFAAAHAAGVNEVLLKGGPDGVWYAGPDGAPRHMPSAAATVLDPVGAGDAMLGGYLAARLSGAPPEAAARIGTHLAAAIVATYGDNAGLPPAAEARALLATALRAESPAASGTPGLP